MQAQLYSHQDFRRAMVNILEDFRVEKDRLEMVHAGVLNILEDFSEGKKRYAQAQTAMLNILQDSDTEKLWLQQSLRAFLNIMEDMDLEKGKSTSAFALVKALTAANKDLDSFAFIASHDLKSPLRVIDNASKWLEDDLREHLTDETRDNMNLLRGRVKRMEKLLDDLLAYSRIGRAMDRPSEIIAGDELINDILKLVLPTTGFCVNVSPGFADIRTERMPLQQILMNLIGNAVKHHDKKQGCIEVALEVHEAYYGFAVKDDGPGIPAQFHEKIFQIFQTLRPRDQVEGSGAGLAMVRRYIEVFGGTLSLDSSEGNGSTFRFTWPKQQMRVDTVPS